MRPRTRTRIGRGGGSRPPCTAEFGFAPGDILALGQHFFPQVLARSGHQVSAAATRFVSGLAAASTSAPMWNDPPDGPLQLRPRRAAAVRPCPARRPGSDRQADAGPRPERGRAAGSAGPVLPAPRACWPASRCCSPISPRRSAADRGGRRGRPLRVLPPPVPALPPPLPLIARHLSHHVAAATGTAGPGRRRAAALILRALAADENAAITSWEDDSGALPALTWTPLPNGSALAALLGLTGTGLIAEYRPAGGAIAWRDGTGRCPASGPSETGRTARCRPCCPASAPR